MRNKININIEFKNRRFLLSAAVVMVVIAIICIINISLGLKSKVIPYGADSKTAFRPYGNETLMYTKDGASYYNSSWDVKWTDAYSMSAPIITKRGEYTAIYETGGRNIRLYNKSGLISSIQTTDTIVRVAIAENGSVGLITNGSSYMVSVYSSAGTLIFQRVESDNGVYPICCDISPDGQIIAIGYMDTSGIKIEAKIGLFYVNADAGAGYTDSMFAAIKKEDEVIFEMFFTSNKNLTVVGDRHIITLSSSGTETSCTEIGNEVLCVGICKNKVALIYGNEIPNKEGEPVGTVAFVSPGGRISVGNSIDAEPDYFYYSDDGIVVGSAGAYYGVDTAGNIKWELYSTDASGIYPASSINNCIYSTRTWAVSANMKGFNSADYENKTENTEGISSTGVTDIPESEVETVAEPIEKPENDASNKPAEKTEDNTEDEQKVKEEDKPADESENVVQEDTDKINENDPGISENTGN